MVVYITYIILHYFENAIDIWSFTTLQNIIDCVSNTFLENSSSVLHFSNIRLNTFCYYTIADLITYLSIVVYLYHLLQQQQQQQQKLKKT